MSKGVGRLCRLRNVQRLAIPFLALVPGCSSERAHSEKVATTSQAIATQIPHVVELVTQYYDNADIVRASYAVGDIGGCTGTMIGPNLMIAAARCGTRRREITFHAFRNALVGSTLPSTQAFPCQYLNRSRNGPRRLRVLGPSSRKPG